MPRARGQSVHALGHGPSPVTHGFLWFWHTAALSLGTQCYRSACHSLLFPACAGISLVQCAVVLLLTATHLCWGKRCRGVACSCGIVLMHKHSNSQPPGRFQVFQAVGAGHKAALPMILWVGPAALPSDFASLWFTTRFAEGPA